MPKTAAEQVIAQRSPSCLPCQNNLAVINALTTERDAARQALAVSEQFRRDDDAEADRVARAAERDELTKKLAAAQAACDGYSADAESMREVLREVKIRIAFIGHPGEPWRGTRGSSQVIGENGPDWGDVCERIDRALAAATEPTEQIRRMTRGHAEAYASACAGWIRGEGTPPPGEVATALAAAQAREQELRAEACALREVATKLYDSHQELHSNPILTELIEEPAWAVLARPADSTALREFGRRVSTMARAAPLNMTHDDVVAAVLNGVTP